MKVNISPRESSDCYAFPQEFLWGCATSSYQIEGAVDRDGRAPSVWDTFCSKPGAVRDGDHGGTATDHYHRYEEDLDLLAWLGVKAYRFSIAWPRILPDGTGSVNEAGLAWYDRLIDGLLARGIEPWVTLYHWDLPQALEDRYGGWRSAETAKAFAEYAGLVTRRLSDRVTHFMTINEFTCFTDLGYETGLLAPGLRLAPFERNTVRHNALLAHGLGVEAIRANASMPVQVGLADNPLIPVPAIDTPEHVEAARQAMRHLNAPFLSAVLEGAYPASYLQAEGADAPEHTDAEMESVASPLDFVGLNMYAPTYVLADAQADCGYRVLPMPPAYPRMVPDWLQVGPQIAYWGPRLVQDLWQPKEIFVTENGCACDDVVDTDGRIYDTDRVMYLRNHLISLHRAVAEGVPVKGYFQWSLLDNFEWADGYSQRFGIVRVDYKTLERTPKLSAQFYRETISRGSVR
jgi:beta-glucosidase